MIDAVRRPLFWGTGLVLLCLLGLAVGRLRGGASATREVERRPVPAVLASVSPDEFVPGERPWAPILRTHNEY